jgi:UDP-N-acetylmuramoyl-tripeptide--D-alanyl-D-alanine ligase
MNFKLKNKILITKFLDESSAELLSPLNKQNYYITKVVTDTRTYEGKGGLFFAIKGRNFDGHNFINQIIDKIDFVVISDKNFIIENKKQKFIVVKDTTLALDNLSALYKNSFPNIKTIAVVGSNGKTTTKELIKSVLSKKYNVVATYQNQNNLIGTAYTLFSITNKTDYCVLELGISLQGEMDVLGKTTQPDCVVMTNIGREHLEFLKTTEIVFREEKKIINYVKQNGLLVLNKDDTYLKTIHWNENKRCYGIYNTTNNLDVYTEDIKFYPTFTEITVVVRDLLGLKFKLPVIKTKLTGVYNVYNILACITCIYFFCIEDLNFISESINEFEPVSMRGTRFELNGNIIIDESYNANPDSMQITISEFLKIFKDEQKVLVLGDMLELGEHTIEEHLKLKNYIDFDRIHLLYLIGNNMKFLYDSLPSKWKKITKHYTDTTSLLNDLKNLVLTNKGLYILFKSSHMVGLSEIVKNLQKVVQQS